eukprot:scaffold4189_cov86-Cylindrotheca_fusiformis.AAC.4
MFRKPNKKKSAKLRTRKRDEDDDEGDDEGDDEDVKAKIREAQKKLKLLSSLPLVTGEYSSSLSKSKTNAPVNPLVESSGGGELSVLDKKHQEAMKNYIEEELNKNGGGGGSSTATTTTDENGTKPVTDQEALYQEIAKELYTATNEKKQSDQEERGAVLVGGTGLAEVILPSSLARETAANKQTNRVYRRDIGSSAVPSNAAVPTSSVAAPLMRSMIHSNKRNSAASQQAQQDEEAQRQEEREADDNRVGFDAYRGKPQDKKPVTKKQRDDHVFSDFMRHQREKFQGGRR